MPTVSSTCSLSRLSSAATPFLHSNHARIPIRDAGFSNDFQEGNLRHNECSGSDFVANAIELGKAYIQHEIASGRIPRAVKSFSAIHEFVDASEFGGLCYYPRGSTMRLAARVIHVLPVSDNSRAVKPYDNVRRHTNYIASVDICHLGVLGGCGGITCSVIHWAWPLMEQSSCTFSDLRLTYNRVALRTINTKCCISGNP